MTRPPLVFLPNATLSESELRAATLDGELVRLGEGFLAVDAPLTPHARALSLAPLLVEPRILISHRSAAWVWGWLQPQPEISTSVPIGARISSGRRRRLGTREVVIDEREVRRWGDVGVTAPARSITDLARHDEGDDVILIMARAFIERPQLTQQVADVLNNGVRASHVRRARERLAEATELLAVAHAIDVVDGVDAPHSIEHAIEVSGVAHLEDEPAESESVA